MSQKHRTITFREQDTNFGGKSVAEILLKDSAERRKVLESDPKPALKASPTKALPSLGEDEHVYETIPESMELEEEQEDKAAHNDSSVSSASQLLEDPSPNSWGFCSPTSDLEGEFPLKRQRGIRRKRQARDCSGAAGKRVKREKLPFIEAVNRHVKRLALETDLDSSVREEGDKLMAEEEKRMDDGDIGIRGRMSLDSCEDAIRMVEDVFRDVDNMDEDEDSIRRDCTVRMILIVNLYFVTLGSMNILDFPLQV